MNDSPAPPVTPTGGATPGPQQSTSLWREHLPFVFLLGVWFAVNLLTLNRYPCAANDEVVYADPAINLLQTGHFTGSCWSNQSSTAFWAVSAPLYPLLLYVWLTVLGYSIFAIRLWNIVLIAASAIILYHAVNKLATIARSGAGLLFALLLLLGYSVIFDYRGGRPDCLCIFLFAAAFFSVVCLSPPARASGVFVSAFLMPWAGLQCLPALAVLGLFLLFLDWKTYGGVVVLAGIGSVCGLGGLLGFFKYHGALEDFHRAIVPQAVQGGVVHAILQGTFTHRNRLPKDFSFCVLFAGAMITELIWWKRSRVSWRTPVILAFAFTVVLSVVLVASGKFPTYYSWMVYLPFSLAVVLEFTNMKEPPIRRRMLGISCALAMVIGVGLHVCAAWYDWPYRDPFFPEALVSRNLRKDDVAYGDPAAYYALRDFGLKPYIGQYILSMRPDEKDRVSVIVDKPENFESTASAIGGVWKQVDEFKPPRLGFLGTSWDLGFISDLNYHLGVYRRVGKNAPGQAAH